MWIMWIIKICSVSLGVLAGLFLRWQVLVVIFILQITLVGMFSFPDNERDDRIGSKVIYTIPTFQLPTWAFYIMTVYQKDILDILFSTIR